ncbi:MAG: hypothetical protein NVS3B18_02410 [Candidatus Dormibacteria bacterium]
MNERIAVTARRRAGRHRLQRVLTLLAVSVALVQLGVAVTQWLHVSPGRERGIDISASYVAAGVWQEGLGDRLYDQHLEAARHGTLNAPGYRTDLPFITPPLTAVAAAPARLLGPGVGLRALSVLEVAALAGALVIAARVAPRPPAWGSTRGVALLLALGALPTLPLLLMGQWDGLCALGLACAYAGWRRDRDLLAGLALALGVGLAKPHLGLGLAAFVVGRRDGRAILGALGGLAGLGIASVLLVGGPACAGFVGALRLSLAHSAPSSTLGVSGFSASWLGSGDAATLLTIGGGLVALAAAGWLGAHSRRPGALEPTLAGATALSLLASPHLLGHDLVLLAPAFVWLALWAASLRSGGGRRLPLPTWVLGLWLLFDLAAVIDLGSAGAAPPGRVVPLVLGAGGLLAFRAAGHQSVAQSGSGNGLAGSVS